MRIYSTALVPLLLPASVLAAPSLFHIPAGPADLATAAFSSAQTWINGALTSAKSKWDAVESTAELKVNVEMLTMGGIEYQSVTHPAFPLHRLRVVTPELCDPNVNQLSGYLDISETKHLFFWFMESRSKPKDDPLVLWLNGGPGCSSTTGLLFELGGCNVANEGYNTTYNPNAWNSVANVLYLDQPVGVGYSYSDEGDVNNSPAAAEDVVAFLTIFISNFKTYAKQDFHIAGESYAGTYLPNIASTIYKHNLALEVAPSGLPTLNFKSVIIGNGLTDPYVQFASVPDFACNSRYAVYDDPDGPECTALRGKVPRCQNLIAGCYKTGSRFACVPAGLYCWSSIYGDLQNLGLNMYDVRRTCDKSKDKDGPLCYKEMGWMETYLNQPEIKKQLGAPDSVTFQSCNMQVNQNFLLHGDGMHNAGALLPELVDAGIRLLIYSGEADMMVNSIGCLRVLDNLPTEYSLEFAQAKDEKFKSHNGTVAGWTKSAGKGAGNVAFVSFRNAGHMVPHDDPPAALAMFERWLKNESLA
ncbi:cathepsin A (carboxypeptidase C), partial [Tremellales sp. Uapishka_1]